MTQHRWSTMDGWDVLAGWDRVQPQHYFIDISRDCPSCGSVEDTDNEECELCHGEGIEYLFNNLDDRTGFTDRLGHMTLTQLHMALKFHLTEWPVTFLANVQDDCTKQAEPYVRYYDNVGQAITIRPLTPNAS